MCERGNVESTVVNTRAGIDWFVDNRNTLTFSGNFTRGQFMPTDVITTRTDSLFSGSIASSQYVRNSDQDRNFRNLGASVQFKHLFPKNGAEWTADLNYNRVRFMGGSEYNTVFDEGYTSQEKQEGLGRGQFMTFQTDFVNPINDHMKIEGGLRAAMPRNKNDNANFYLNQDDNTWVQVASLAPTISVSWPVAGMTSPFFTVTPQVLQTSSPV